MADEEFVQVGIVSVLDAAIAALAHATLAELVGAALSQPAAHLGLPGYSFEARSGVPATASLVVTARESESASVSLDAPDRLVVSGVRSDGRLASALPYIGYSLAERELQRLFTTFTMRAVVVSRNNEAVLLVGGKSAGKTSLAIELCTRYEFRFVADSLVHVGRQDNHVEVRGGSDWIKLRPAAIDAHHSSLAGFTGSVASRSTAVEVCRPEELGLLRAELPVRVRQLFAVNVRTEECVPEVRSMSPLDARLLLYEEASRYIRGTATPVVLAPGVGSVYVPSLDDPSLHGKRTRLVDDLLECSQPRHLVATLRDAAAIIAD